MEPTWIVICRDDDEADGTPGEYVLATRRTFAARPEAAAYASTIAPGRLPIVVECPRGVTYPAPDQQMAHALGVFVLNHRIREWMEQNDPKALEQAIDALTGYEPTYATRLAEARFKWQDVK